MPQLAASHQNYFGNTCTIVLSRMKKSYLHPDNEPNELGPQVKHSMGSCSQYTCSNTECLRNICFHELHRSVLHILGSRIELPFVTSFKGLEAIFVIVENENLPEDRKPFEDWILCGVCAKHNKKRLREFSRLPLQKLGKYASMHNLCMAVEFQVTSVESEDNWNSPEELENLLETFMRVKEVEIVIDNRKLTFTATCTAGANFDAVQHCRGCGSKNYLRRVKKCIVAVSQKKSSACSEELCIHCFLKTSYEYVKIQDRNKLALGLLSWSLQSQPELPQDIYSSNLVSPIPCKNHASNLKQMFDFEAWDLSAAVIGQQSYYPEPDGFCFSNVMYLLEGDHWKKSILEFNHQQAWIAFSQVIQNELEKASKNIDEDQDLIEEGIQEAKSIIKMTNTSFTHQRYTIEDDEQERDNLMISKFTFCQFLDRYAMSRGIGCCVIQPARPDPFFLCNEQQICLTRVTLINWHYKVTRSNHFILVPIIRRDLSLQDGDMETQSTGRRIDEDHDGNVDMNERDDEDGDVDMSVPDEADEHIQLTPEVMKELMYIKEKSGNILQNLSLQHNRDLKNWLLHAVYLFLWILKKEKIETCLSSGSDDFSVKKLLRFIRRVLSLLSYQNFQLPTDEMYKTEILSFNNAYGDISKLPKADKSTLKASENWTGMLKTAIIKFIEPWDDWSSWNPWDVSKRAVKSFFTYCYEKKVVQLARKSTSAQFQAEEVRVSISAVSAPRPSARIPVFASAQPQDEHITPGSTPAVSSPRRSARIPVFASAQTQEEHMTPGSTPALSSPRRSARIPAPASAQPQVEQITPALTPAVSAPRRSARIAARTLVQPQEEKVREFVTPALSRPRRSAKIPAQASATLNPAVSAPLQSARTSAQASATLNAPVSASHHPEDAQTQSRKRKTFELYSALDATISGKRRRQEEEIAAEESQILIDSNARRSLAFIVSFCKKFPAKSLQLLNDIQFLLDNNKSWEDINALMIDFE